MTPPLSALSAFKLRPRSNSHPLIDAEGFAIGLATSSQEKPIQYGTAISPDLLMQPSVKGIAAPLEFSPPVFTSFADSGSWACTSPIKKQKTIDGRLSTDTSPSEGDEEFPLMPPTAPIFSPMASFPSTPINVDLDQTPSSNGKRSVSPDEGHADREAPNPFTPRGRKLMQNFCINSPSPTFSSVAATPKTVSSCTAQLGLQNLPNVPTFPFSPSLNFGKDCISNTADSSARDTILFSTGSTLLETPKRGPRSCTASANSSPFKRTPIGHQRGSVFKTLPPRTIQSPSVETARPGENLNENVSRVFKATTPGIYPNGRDDGAFSSPFSTSSSPSPRVVPITVLSLNGSPVLLPTSNVLSSSMPSPLMLSLDQVAKTHDKKDAEGISLGSPRPAGVKLFSSECRVLPKIKLTPRGRNKFGSVKPNPLPVGSCGGLAMPTLTMLPAKKPDTHMLVLDIPGDREADEMDSLLNGFENHKAAHYGKKDQKQERCTGEHKLKIGELDRVESEEAEMVALTQDRFQMPAIWLPPSAVFNEKDDRLRSSFTYSDEYASKLSPDDRKPMPSITLNVSSGQDAHASQLSGRSPSFLPTPAPIAQNKSHSLFDTSNARDGALERILQADAITEAARSNEPLTDEDSDIDGDDADFLLCLPQANQGGENHYRPLKVCSERMAPFKSSCSNSRAESPSFNRCPGSRGSCTMRSKFSDHSLHQGFSSPTIFEEGFSSVDNSTNTRPYHALKTPEEMDVRKSDSTFPTFCSISDCDGSEMMTSPKLSSRTKTTCSSRDRQSVSSFLSMSSLCGLDIVQEKSSGFDLHTRVSGFSPSESTEFSSTMFKPRMRSELSMNSLGLSVDSIDVSIGRDLFTPPMMAGVQSSNRMCSPPPIQSHGY